MENIELENLEMVLVDDMNEDGLDYPMQIELTVAPNYPDLEELKKIKKPIFISATDYRGEIALGLTRTQTKELIAHLELLLNASEG